MNNALVSNDLQAEEIDEEQDKPNMYSIMQQNNPQFQSSDGTDNKGGARV